MQHPLLPQVLNAQLQGKGGKATVHMFGHLTKDTAAGQGLTHNALPYQCIAPPAYRGLLISGYRLALQVSGSDTERTGNTAHTLHAETPARECLICRPHLTLLPPGG